MATYRKRNGKWQVQVRRTGQSPISRTFTHKADAERWSREMERAADRGELDSELCSSTARTVGDLLRRYRDEVTVHKRGCEAETYVINALLRQAFCSEIVTQVTAQPFSKYRDYRMTKVAGATVRRQLSVLQHAFEIARNEWGWRILTNPIQTIRKPTNGKARERRLNAIEESHILRECNNCKNPWIEPCVRLAIETAMRRAEILRMQWSDINWENQTLHIPETKNGHPRTIPLTEDAVRLLELLPHSLGGRIIPISATCLRMAWDRALRRAEIKDFRFHDLRHEAITRFFERGLSVPEVALISGHRDYRMLSRYTHLRPEDVSKKLALLNATG
jgi:integrase